MYNFIHDPEAANTWDVRELPDTEDVDIPDRHQAAKSTTIPRRMWVMKHRHSMTGIWKLMRLCKYRSTQKCPRCGKYCETVAHITLCTAPLAIEQWKTSLKKLEKDLAKCHLQPGLTRFLKSRLLECKTRTALYRVLY
jgi:hypothetical protein